MFNYSCFFYFQEVATFDLTKRATGISILVYWKGVSDCKRGNNESNQTNLALLCKSYYSIWMTDWSSSVFDNYHWVFWIAVEKFSLLCRIIYSLRRIHRWKICWCALDPSPAAQPKCVWTSGHTQTEHSSSSVFSGREQIYGAAVYRLPLP